MNRLGDVFPKRALVLLGALIVGGGFVLALISNTGLYGTFGPTSGVSSDVLLNGNGSYAAGGLPYYSANAQLTPNHQGGYTQVVALATTTTMSSTSVVNFGQGNAPQPLNSSGGSSGGTGGFLEFDSTLGIQSASPPQTASSIIALAYSVGGYVAFQSTYKDSANVVIRIPASQYQQIVNQIEAMGTFVNIQSSSNDATVQYTDLNATLASLQTEQQSLLRLLNETTDVNSTLAIEAQLQGVDAQINEVESSILQTRTLIQFATINVQITEGNSSTRPTVTVTASPSNGTAPFSVTFNAIVKGGTAPYIINWNFGDGSADQGQVLIHTYYQSGDFKVTVSVTDQAGNVTTASTRVHVDLAPGQVGAPNFFSNVANLFVSVLEGIVEVAVVVLPIAAVGALVILPFRKRGKIQGEIKQSQ